MTARANKALLNIRQRWALTVGAHERGDVPGWVMITLMTAVIVVLIWGIASEQLQTLLTSAFSKVTNKGNGN
jgi:hypothetical protein